MSSVDRLTIERGVLRRGARTLFPSLDLRIGLGETLAILGVSGIGKSSLLNALAGEGSVTLSGVRWGAGEKSTARPRLGFATQPNPIPAWMPVGAFLSTHYVGHESERNFAMAASEACAIVELEYKTIRRQLGRELSHGMQSRLGLAALLLLDAPINLIDEPFSGVDEALRRRLLPIVRQRFTGEARMTLLVTHSPMEAMLLANRLVVLSDREGLRELAPSPPVSEDAFLAQDAGVRAACLEIFESLNRDRHANSAH